MCWLCTDDEESHNYTAQAERLRYGIYGQNSGHGIDEPICVLARITTSGPPASSADIIVCRIDDAADGRNSLRCSCAALLLYCSAIIE